MIEGFYTPQHSLVLKTRLDALENRLVVAPCATHNLQLLMQTLLHGPLLPLGTSGVFFVKFWKGRQNGWHDLLSALYDKNLFDTLSPQLQQVSSRNVPFYILACIRSYHLYICI